MLKHAPTQSQTTTYKLKSAKTTYKEEQYSRQCHFCTATYLPLKRAGGPACSGVPSFFLPFCYNPLRKATQTLSALAGGGGPSKAQWDGEGGYRGDWGRRSSNPPHSLCTGILKPLCWWLLVTKGLEQKARIFGGMALSASSILDRNGLRYQPDAREPIKDLKPAA